MSVFPGRGESGPLRVVRATVTKLHFTSLRFTPPGWSSAARHVEVGGSLLLYVSRTLRLCSGPHTSTGSPGAPPPRTRPHARHAPTPARTERATRANAEERRCTPSGVSETSTAARLQLWTARSRLERPPGVAQGGSTLGAPRRVEAPRPRPRAGRAGPRGVIRYRYLRTCARACLLLNPAPYACVWGASWTDCGLRRVWKIKRLCATSRRCRRHARLLAPRLSARA